MNSNITLKKIIRKSKKIICWNIIVPIFKLIPVNKNTIYFESFLGKSYDDNPQAIYEYIYENKEFKCVWGLKELDKELDGPALKVKRMRLKYLYYISTAKFIVNNSRMPNNFKTRKKQIYIQTWHGTPLKKLAFDMEEVHLPGTNKEKYFENFANEVTNWDYLISPNEYSTKIFKRAFDFKGEILKSGYPRNDILKKVENRDLYRDLVKEKLNIDLDKKVILYTPTFRDDEYISKGNYIQNLELEFADKYIEENCVILIRCHYLVKQFNPGNINNKFKWIDVSKYEDINDLYLAADVLITDYSSTFFDFSLLKKPILFYQYDHLKFKNVLRDFYLKDKELPSKPIYNSEDLENELINVLKNGQKYQKQFQEIAKNDLSEYKIDSPRYIFNKIFKPAN